MFVCPECGSPQPMPGHCGADGTLLAPVGEDVLLGMTIGAYRVARLLGVGGMGRVYKGVQPQIGSRVAIKVLSRECADRKDLVDRFFSEAKAVNLIRHESIVNVLDLATLPDGRPYIIMEYLDGVPLAAIVDAIATHGPMPIGGLARLAVEVLDALGAAHAKGIVHRDLKPDNIFVTPAGRPKVLDFGIAKLLPELGGSYTQTGSLLGTPHYMAPEQAAGRPIDYRADLYAMGVILFECATGHKPFNGDSLFDLLRKHVETAPPSPRSFRSDLPPSLEAVILTSLAKAPEHRFASAQAMSLALQQATAGLPPDQWAPITGVTASTGARVPSGAGWGGTPPSWGGATHPTTVAGQVGAAVAKPAKKSRAGVWIALIAVCVIGGGVTAAVVASGGGDSGGAGSGSAVAVGGGGSATPTIPVAAKPVALPPRPPVVGGGSAVVMIAAGSAVGSGSAAGSAAGSAEIAPGSDDDADADMDAAFADLDKQLQALDPAIAKSFGKLGDVSQRMKAIMKLPAAQRAKALADLQREIEAAATIATDDDPLAPTPKAKPKQPPAVPVPPAGPVPPPTSALPPGTWIKLHNLPPPAGWNPAHVDVAAFFPWAIAAARKMVPDAMMIRIDADDVYADGHADLTLTTNASIDVRFISPSRSIPDPSIPIGVPQKWECEFRVMADASGVMTLPISGSCASEVVLPLPRCSPVALWKKAIAKNAPSGNAVGEMGYRAPGKHEAPRWYFDVKGAFSEVLPDDCH